MAYCPKCGISSDQQVGTGNALLSCSSCSVVWSEFLETMADDALWPAIVTRDKHEIICPKCGYERYPSDKATPRTTCPDCRVRYTESLAPRPIEPQKTETIACEFCGEQILAVAKKCKHCESMLDISALPLPNVLAKDVSSDQLVNGSASPTDQVRLASLREEVSSLVRAGKTIDAIKRYRAETGVGLKEAKDYVDSQNVVMQKAAPLAKSNIGVQGGGKRRPLLLGLVVIGIVVITGLSLFVKFRHDQVDQAHLQGLVGSLAAAIAQNHAEVLIANGNGQSITNCMDVSRLKRVEMPSGFSISDKVISNTDEATCIVTSPRGESRSLTVRGILVVAAPIPTKERAENYSSSKSSASETADCYDFAKFVEAKGHGWLEKSALVASAEKRGDCVWKHN